MSTEPVRKNNDSAKVSHTLHVSIDAKGPERGDDDRPYVAHVLICNSDRDDPVLDKTVRFETADEMLEWVDDFDRKLAGEKKVTLPSGMAGKPSLLGSLGTLVDAGLTGVGVVVHEVSSFSAKMKDRLPGAKSGDAKEKTSETAEEVKSNVAETKESVTEKVFDVTDDVKEKVADTKEVVADHTEQVKEEVADNADDVNEEVVDTASEVKEDVADTAGDTKGTITERTEEIKNDSTEGDDADDGVESDSTEDADIEDTDTEEDAEAADDVTDGVDNPPVDDSEELEADADALSVPADGQNLSGEPGLDVDPEDVAFSDVQDIAPSGDAPELLPENGDIDTAEDEGWQVQDFGDDEVPTPYTEEPDAHTTVMSTTTFAEHLDADQVKNLEEVANGDDTK